MGQQGFTRNKSVRPPMAHNRTGISAGSVFLFWRIMVKDETLPYLYENMQRIIRAGGLPLWTVYSGARDFPDHYVARLFDTDKPTPVVIASKDLVRVRERLIDLGLVRLDRGENDEPHIMETWV